MFEQKQYMLRKIGGSGSFIRYGITLPSHVAMQFGERTCFFLEIDNESIILKSGASITPTQKEIESFDLEDLK